MNICELCGSGNVTPIDETPIVTEIIAGTEVNFNGIPHMVCADCGALFPTEAALTDISTAVEAIDEAVQHRYFPGGAIPKQWVYAAATLPEYGKTTYICLKNESERPIRSARASGYGAWKLGGSYRTKKDVLFWAEQKRASRETAAILQESPMHIDN